MDLTRFEAPVENPLGSVLLAHGFGEHRGRYAEFIAALNSADYDVWAFDFPGHGASAGRRGVVDVGALIAAHLTARRQLEGESRTRKTFLFGHSMGGLVTLASALLSPAGLAAVAVTGPALRPLPKVPLPVATVGSWVGRVAPGLKTVAVDTAALSHDPKVAAAYAADPLVYEGKVPLLTGATMVRQGDQVIANAAMLTVPTLILHGEDDRLADVAGSRQFSDNAGNQVELLVKPGAYHELLNELDRDEYTKEIIDWYRLW